jgi:aspartate/glutamate racemase
MAIRIALIHALAHSMAPINDAFVRHWPGVERMNLLDDSLATDRAGGRVHAGAAMHERFQRLARYVVDCGAGGILFTCSAFGECIDAVAREHARIPVLKPNEAMVAQAVRHGGKLGLLATFGPTLESMKPEFPPGIDVETMLVKGGLDALDAQQAERHDELIARAAHQLADRGCTQLALAQFSMARAREACEAATGLPVLTTVDSAVLLMRQRIGHP